MNIKVAFEQQVPHVALSMLNIKSLPESCLQAIYQSTEGRFSFLLFLNSALFTVLQL